MERGSFIFGRRGQRLYRQQRGDTPGHYRHPAGKGADGHRLREPERAVSIARRGQTSERHRSRDSGEHSSGSILYPNAGGSRSEAQSLDSSWRYEKAPERTNKSGCIDVNSASAAQLHTIVGIGRAKARGMMQHPERNGPFRNLADLLNAQGIGAATLRNTRKAGSCVK